MGSTWLDFRSLTVLRNPFYALSHRLYHCPIILWCMFIPATKYCELRPVQYRNKRKTPDILRLLPEVRVDLAALNSAITSA
jgi:hypothetical protein